MYGRLLHDVHGTGGPFPFGQRPCLCRGQLTDWTRRLGVVLRNACIVSVVLMRTMVPPVSIVLPALLRQSHVRDGCLEGHAGQGVRRCSLEYALCMVVCVLSSWSDWSDFHQRPLANMDSHQFTCFQTVGLIPLVHEVLRTRKEERIRSLAVWSEQDMATRTLQWLQDTVVSLALFSFRQARIFFFGDNFKCSSCDAWSLPLAALHCWTERVTY